MMTDRVEEFFYRAMREGYASYVQPEETIAQLPGSKMITYQEDDLKLVDFWLATRGGRSSGNTIIFHENNPVWQMHYWGWYNDEVISFLKRVLLADYGRNHLGGVDFLGCRGPKIFTGTTMTYINIVDDGGMFTHFSGREEIFSNSTGHTGCGWHKYHGGCF